MITTFTDFNLCNDIATHSQKVLFLDRDGVINYDYGYVHRVDQFDFIPSIFDLCQRAQTKGYKIVIVTNQAGIAKGLYDFQALKTVTRFMISQFRAEGINISGFYFSPYHVDGIIPQLSLEHITRKPNPGLILQAQKDMNINLDDSLIVGDQVSDMEAGYAAGIPRRILYNPNLKFYKTKFFEDVQDLKEIYL